MPETTKPPIILRSGDTAFVFEPDEDMSPEVEALLFQYLGGVIDASGGRITADVPGYDVATAQADAGAFGLDLGITGQSADLAEFGRLLAGTGGRYGANISNDLGQYAAYDNILRGRASSSGGSGGYGAQAVKAAAVRAEQERLDLERQATIKKMVREEEDRQFEFDRQGRGLQIALMNARNEAQQVQIFNQLDSLSKQRALQDRAFEANLADIGLSREDLAINTGAFNRGVSTTADPFRGLVNSLGASGKVAEYARRVRDLEIADSQKKLALQAQGIDIEEEKVRIANQAAVDTRLDREVALNAELAAAQQTNDLELLEAARQNRNGGVSLAASRAIEDKNEALVNAINALGKSATPTVSSTTAGSGPSAFAKDAAASAAANVRVTTVQGGYNPAAKPLAPPTQH